MLGVVGRGLPAAAQEDSYDQPYDDQDEGGAQDEAPNPQDYEQALAPHGDWLESPSYGPVWRPWVTAGWQPYVDGYWAWSPQGWLWVSYEPWAWTFHYGRWVLVSGWGWVWVPGTVWAPAWVDWYWGDGFVGWAPLAPFATHVTVFNSFVFVHERDFCGRPVHDHFMRHDRVPKPVVDDWRGRRDSRPPSRDSIQRVSGRALTELTRPPQQARAPWERQGARPGRRQEAGLDQPERGRGARQQRTVEALGGTDEQQQRAPRAGRSAPDVQQPAPRRDRQAPPLGRTGQQALDDLQAPTAPQRQGGRQGRGPGVPQSMSAPGVPQPGGPAQDAPAMGGGGGRGRGGGVGGGGGGARPGGGPGGAGGQGQVGGQGGAGGGGVAGGAGALH